MRGWQRWACLQSARPRRSPAIKSLRTVECGRQTTARRRRKKKKKKKQQQRNQKKQQKKHLLLQALNPESESYTAAASLRGPYRRPSPVVAVITDSCYSPQPRLAGRPRMQHKKPHQAFPAAIPPLSSSSLAIILGSVPLPLLSCVAVATVGVRVCCSHTVLSLVCFLTGATVFSLPPPSDSFYFTSVSLCLRAKVLPANPLLLLPRRCRRYHHHVIIFFMPFVVSLHT